MELPTDSPSSLKEKNRRKRSVRRTVDERQKNNEVEGDKNNEKESDENNEVEGDTDNEVNDDKDDNEEEGEVQSKYFKRSSLADIRSKVKRSSQENRQNNDQETVDNLASANTDLTNDAKSCMRRLTREDFQKQGITLAKYLLGKVICRHDGKNGLLSGRIVETEAYLGVIDKACHTFGEKQTERVKPMYMVEGTSYVYSIYGMYFCLNISSSDHGGCVLIRALEPISGNDLMIFRVL